MTQDEDSQTKVGKPLETSGQHITILKIKLKAEKMLKKSSASEAAARIIRERARKYLAAAG